MLPEHIWLISGYAGSGKDTTAEILRNLLVSATRNAFADAVKDEVAGMYELERRTLDTQEGKARSIRLLNSMKTVRQLIIEHAESTKEEHGPAVWAKRLQAPNTTHWILSDWRFLEELACLRERFPHAVIHTMRVIRHEVTPLASHTEHELDEFPCEYTIENSGSLLYIGNQLARILN